MKKKTTQTKQTKEKEKEKNVDTKDCDRKKTTQN